MIVGSKDDFLGERMHQIQLVSQTIFTCHLYVPFKEGSTSTYLLFEKKMWFEGSCRIAFE